MTLQGRRSQLQGKEGRRVCGELTGIDITPVMVPYTRGILERAGHDPHLERPWGGMLDGGAWLFPWGLDGMELALCNMHPCADRVGCVLLMLLWSRCCC